jgi:UDPglucose 6-dehydrogenase
MKISVVGLGKLGSPIVAVLAAKGYDVVGIDTNAAFVEKINNHIAPVQEPQLQELLTAHKARISATSDWAHAIVRSDVTCIIVPTPSGADFVMIVSSRSWMKSAPSLRRNPATIW